MNNSTGKIEITCIHNLDLSFTWDWEGCGFGGYWTFKHPDGRIELENECMSRERVRKVLHALADHIADSYIEAGEFVHDDDDLYRVWPDGTVQPVSEGPAYSHMSDDYRTVLASNEEDAEYFANFDRRG